MPSEHCCVKSFTKTLFHNPHACIINILWWYSSSLLACLSPFFFMFWYFPSSSCLPSWLSSQNSVYEKKHLIFVFWVWFVFLKYPFLSLFLQMTFFFFLLLADKTSRSMYAIFLYPFINWWAQRLTLKFNSCV